MKKMKHLSPAVTSREVNQRSGEVMKRSRQEVVVIPVTFGRKSVVTNYIVPNDVEAVEELLKHIKAQPLPQPSARNRFLAARSSMGGKVADTLDQLRNEESN